MTDLQDVEAERAIIAAILADPSCLSRLTALDPQHFGDGKMAVLFETIRTMQSDGEMITVPTLTARFRGDVYGMADLRALEDFAFAGHGAEPLELAQRVIETATRRKLAAIFEGARDQILNPAVSAAKTASEVAESVRKQSLLLRSNPDDEPTWARTRAMLFDFLYGDRGLICSTGHPDLDKLLGGWQRGSYAVVGARPSMGKSTALVDFGVRAALQGVGVLWVTAEMPVNQIALRTTSHLVCGHNYDPTVPYMDLLHRKESAEQRNVAERALREIGTLPLAVMYPKAKTPEAIAVEAMRIQESMASEGVELGLVIVDHIGKLHSDKGRKSDNKTVETGRVSDALHSIALDLDIQVIAASQLNRESIKSDSKEPSIEHLRNSGDIEQDVDTVIMLHRPEYYAARERPKSAEEAQAQQDRLRIFKNYLAIPILKSRNGIVGRVNMQIDLANSYLSRWTKEDPHLTDNASRA
jgi:replicative DNA helicase